MSRLRRVKRQTTLDNESVLVVSPTARTRDDTSILLASRTSTDDAIPTSFSVSALTTITQTSTSSSAASDSPSSPSSSSNDNGSSSSVGLIAGLVVGLTVVIIALVVLLLKCSRKKGNPRNTTTLTSLSPPLHSLPPITDDASHYPESEKGTLRPNPRKKSSLSRRASVASWLSGKSKMWRRASADRFEWYRSGLDDNVHLTKVPTPEMFERASPLQELTERATMGGAWSKEISEPSLSHFSLSRDIPDSESLRDRY